MKCEVLLTERIRVTYVYAIYKLLKGFRLDLILGLVVQLVRNSVLFFAR
jgi:hypothetical protein